ncbi:MAG: acyltransferase family protein [Planctomycetota bacterium]
MGVSIRANLSELRSGATGDASDLSLRHGCASAPATLFETAGNALATIFLAQSWSPYSAQAWNPPAWFLSCEAFFYLLFPWLAAWIDRRSTHGLLMTVGWMWVFSLVPTVIYESLAPDGAGRIVWTSEAFWLFVVKFNPLLRLPEFIAGIALGKLYLRNTPRDLSASHFRGALLSTIGIVGVTIMCVTSESFSFLKLHNGLLTPFFDMTIYGLARGGGPIAAFLRHPRMVLLGDASYALYIFHYAVITYLMVIIAIARGRILGPMGFLFVCVGIALVISVLIYLHYEIPARKRLLVWLGVSSGD